jgi:2-C-methyl-D-erythritol 2,4-cyclodiphosphate synthase
VSQRVGIGIDVHRFGEDASRTLVLGGVAFPGEAGLEGHSDADVVAHAVCDALFGAAGLGDIGMHFPDTDEAWRGADSLVLLAEAAERVKTAGYRLVNADCSVVTERPRLATFRQEMMDKLSAAAGGPVHVKATRPESLGAIGRVEGIACFAVATIEELD